MALIPATSRVHLSSFTSFTLSFLPLLPLPLAATLSGIAAALAHKIDKRHCESGITASLNSRYEMANDATTTNQRTNE
eukprot:6709854-Pyramimonas_sp.AAC.1